MSLATYLVEIEAARQLPFTDGLAQLRAMTTRLRAELPDDPRSEAVWSAWSAALSHLDGLRLLSLPDPLAAAVAEQRPDVAVTLGTDAAYACVLEQAKAHCAMAYYDTRPGWLYAAATFATTPARRAEVVTLLGGELQRMVDARLGGGDLVNAVALDAAARALLRLRPVEALAALGATMRFCGHEACHYEGRQAGGAVAMALAATGDASTAPEVRAWVEDVGERHDGARFVMEARYSLWLLSGDVAGARAYLEDPDHTKGLAFVVAALADLHAPEAIGAIEARLATVRNPVTREAFIEGLARLRAQKAPPPVEARMFWLFGVRSPTELALGAESDDVFLQRARLADRELGQVTEVDDSPLDD